MLFELRKNILRNDGNTGLFDGDLDVGIKIQKAKEIGPEMGT